MLSILIVNWNTRDLLRKCLASIQAHPPSEPCETIVVDNASSDGSAEMVRGEFPEVKLIEPGKNTGYARGNNLAYEQSEGEFVLTLNPDTEVVDDSLDRALHILRVNPTVGCLGARQISPDGSTQASIRGFPSFVGIVGDLTGLGRRFPGTKLDSYRLTAFDYEQEQPAPQPMGTFLLLRREAVQSVSGGIDEGDGIDGIEQTSPLNSINSIKTPPPAPNPDHPKSKLQTPNSNGFLDESFPIFFNEVDLLYRLKQAGWDTLYAPSVRILHHGGESTKQVRKSMIWESHRSLVRFLRKHHRSLPSRLGLFILAPLIYAAASVRAKGYDAGFRA